MRLFHRYAHDDEAGTVQVSDANSHLGHLLLESSWEELLDYLSTDEGRRDVNARNDPLGLSKGVAADKRRGVRIPQDKDTAFFAALFVRAPYEAIVKIYAAAPAQVHHPEDLLYSLLVVPSEEEARAEELRKRAPHRTRSWTADEYYRVLDLLLQALVSARLATHEAGAELLQFWPKWMVCDRDDVALTPLAVAAHNPDVPAPILQLVCALQPAAMEKECRIFGRRTLPLVVAAASPLPPASSPRYEEAKERRWEKVTLLTLHKSWYHGYYDTQRELLKEAVASKAHDVRQPLVVAARPEPTPGKIKEACDEAVRLKEWELVREFLRRHDSAELESIRAALARHDETAGAEAEKQERTRERKKVRDEWLHKNMGFVMYPVNGLLDLVSAVLPPDMLKHEEPGPIVRPMS